MTWERVERLDAEWAATALYNESGVLLAVEGPCPGGQVGAAYVRWPDGHRSILKRRQHTDLFGQQAVPDILRSAGYPAPATELTARIGDLVVTVQELLPGNGIGCFDEHHLDQAIALNHLQADQLTDRPDIPLVNLYLHDDGPGFCLHEPLRQHNTRTAALERWITGVAADHLDGNDALHMDFHPGNMLATNGTITGVIDWDGAARGDRRLDLVTLRFGLESEPTAPGVAARLDAVLDTFPADILRATWAHMSLRMTDWAIRHFTPADVERWLDFAGRRID